ncbi:3'-5' exonuclease [Pokkaliibacter plantistimulans]|uniref:3'-5' exonuclease n=1 Tax=Pokkaliibacter plantistimulans TaxID=1635171 RepID=UPI000CE480B0|nr:3'-5' exonuclease [Pokkaliibacter plantistimulans]
MTYSPASIELLDHVCPVILGRSFVIIDVETTGFGANASVTEAAGILVTVELHDGIAQFVPAAAMSVHLCAMSALNTLLSPMESPTLKLTQFLQTAVAQGAIYVAHNAGFDHRMLQQVIQLPPATWLCTLNDLEWCGKGRRLEQIYQQVYGSVQMPHKALDDATILLNLLNQLAVKPVINWLGMFDAVVE